MRQEPRRIIATSNSRVNAVYTYHGGGKLTSSRHHTTIIRLTR